MKKKLTFDPKLFSEKTYKEYKGEEIWELLNSETAVYLMEFATKCEMPAIVGIEKYLVDNLGIDILFEDKVPQMIGHMTRQVMEQHAYKLKKEDVGCLEFLIFRTGDLYVHKNKFKNSSEYRNLKYDPQPFYEEVYKKYEGSVIWKYLLSIKANILMSIYSAHDKPVVAGIEKDLIDLVGSEILSKDEVRRMVGHMIKQIMEYFN